MEKVTGEKYYPYVGFHFRVTIDGAGGPADIRFQSVSGLNSQIQTETYKEGGENRFEHMLPTRSKASDLVLKRGILHPGNSSLTQWVKDAIEHQDIKPRNLLVQLYGEDNKTPLLTWKIEHAWPKNWKVGDLNAERGEVLIETFELVVNRCTLQKD